MEVTVNRFYHGANYIIGRLYVNGTYICDTLEPPLTRKLFPGVLPGRYKLLRYPSKKFRGYRPLVFGVHGRDGILIHEGNSVEDTKGCILVGYNTKVGKVTSSKLCLDKLMGVLLPAWKSGEEVILSYS